MFYKEGEFEIKQSWNIQDLLKGNENENDPTNKAAKNLDKFKRSNSKEKAEVVPDSLDQEIANRIIRDLHRDGAFKKKDNPILKPKLPPTNLNKPITGGQNKIPNGNGLPKSSNHSSNMIGPKDTDIVSMMAQRLSKLEMTAHNQREEIKEQAQKIIKLEEENALLKLSKDAGELLRLKEENQRLRKQVSEMEKFLSDYGLKWVGTEAKDQKKGDFKVDQLIQDIDQSKPLFRSNLPKEIDMAIITRRIEELNIVAAQDGEHQIVKVDGAHQFKKREPLPIGFFKDGLMIKGYPFYKYSSREAQQIMEDILDGYFPSIMRQKYPDGTFFKLINKIDLDFKDATKNNSDFATLEGQGMQIDSREDLLNRLPKQVIKNGKIISVRDEIAKTFEKNDAKRAGVATDDKCTLEGEVNITTETEKKLQNNQLTEEEKGKLINLKIRTESGKRTLLMKVLYTEKISAIYQTIKSYSETKAFEIWGGYPPRAYQNEDNKTLEDFDITDDSVFNLRSTSK